ncbi:MAG TPA: nitronate monooxygenase [Burkholderiaceae bacterium]|nr:nitronate monooxygenase [Burkholderiaceae bacterium]
MVFPQLRIPVIQAPMAGGPSTPALAAAVIRAGGMGSLGVAYLGAERIAQDIRQTRALCEGSSGPLNVNLFIFPPPFDVDAAQARRAEAVLAPLAQALGEPVPRLPVPPWHPPLTEQLEVIWAERPEVLSLHFGLPDPDVVERAHTLGIRVGITATCVQEALAIERIGADFVVAQGIEAGGHRGEFELSPTAPEGLSSLELLGALAGRLRIPIVAAGGLMDGADVARVLRAGAAAAQLGTAFLLCPEAGTTPSYRDLLRSAAGQAQRPVQFTRAFSGRWAQGIENAFMRAVDAAGSTLPFPAQNALTATLRSAAARHSNAEHQSCWAGRALQRIRELPAEQLMHDLAAEIAQHR